jgi:hypothetical protein
MKIVYDVSKQEVVRMDTIALSEGEFLGKKVENAGEKKVSAGVKHSLSTASNQVLQRAVQALNKYITIEGGLTGSVSPPAKKGDMDAAARRRLDALLT